jgi:hypothetical protein
LGWHGDSFRDEGNRARLAFSQSLGYLMGRPSRSSTSPRPGPRNASAAFGFSGDDRSLDAIIEIALGRAIDARTKAAFPQLAAVPQLLDHVATYTEPRCDLALLKELVSPPTFGFVNGG